ncbi:MAG: hypothetical protein ACI4RV_03685 [Eubacteriales bacterium]
MRLYWEVKMMLDNRQLKKLLSLSDDELRQTVGAAAIAAGADRNMAARALADTDRLRAMMSALSAEQINAMLAQIGPETANELAKRIRRD